MERGNRVLALARFRGTGRDGIRLDRATANVFEFADGLIVRHQSHMAEPEGALAEFESGD